MSTSFLASSKLPHGSSRLKLKNTPRKTGCKALGRRAPCEAWGRGMWAAAAAAGKGNPPSVAAEVKQAECRVCTHQTCRKMQGSHETLQYFKDLAPPGVHVEACGCLGNCGKGPNVAVLRPGTELIVNYVNTPAHVAALLEKQCGGVQADEAVEVLALKVKGNDAFQSGDLDGAADLYARALAIQPSAPTLANRSALRLELGDAQGALDDAEAAAALDPTWHKAQLRAADAHEALGDVGAAAECCDRALVLQPSLRKAGGFVQRCRRLQRALEEVNVSA